MVRSPIHPFNPDEARRFMRAIDGNRLEALYTLAVTTGARLGELLTLRWEDVDLDGASLAIRGTLQRVAGTLQVVPTKTAKSRRTLSLTRHAVGALRRHRDRQAEERAVMGSRWRGTGFVFTTSIGTALEGRAVYGAFIELLDGSGLPRRRFHDLRHTAATLMLAAGVPARVVMEILGHSQLALTTEHLGDTQLA